MLFRSKDTYGSTPLHDAAANSSSPAMLEVLLKAGADVYAKDKCGNTPLHLAASFSAVAEVEVLLKAGADPSAIDNAGKTPHAVAKHENRDILSKARRIIR